MRDRIVGAALLCSIPLAACWLLYRGVQWERRRGFRGRYDQPVEPWGEVPRVPQYSWTENGGRSA